MTFTATELATKYTVADIENILREGRDAAYKAADTFECDVMQGGWGECGFAWVVIGGIKGNTKIGRMLKSVGVDQNHLREFYVWNPSGYPTQNVDTLEAGAIAFAKVLKHYGFEAYAQSRLD